MRYLYEGHLGRHFVTDAPLSFNDTYCDECGDYDSLVGNFSSVKEFWELIRCDCDTDGNGGYSLQYIYPFMLSTFENMENKARYEGEDSWTNEICSNSDEEILNYIVEAIEEEKINKGMGEGND